MDKTESLKGKLAKYSNELQEIMPQIRSGKNDAINRAEEVRAIITDLQTKIKVAEDAEAREIASLKGEVSKEQSEIRFLSHEDKYSDVVSGGMPDGLGLSDINSGRMIRGMVTGNWKGAEAEQRALMGQEDPAGGYWLPGGLANRYIDLARANMVTSSAGAITIPVETDSLTVPKVTADPQVYWRGELEEITEGDPVFGAVKLQPKVCACLIKISEELYQDGQGVGDAVQEVMTRAIGNELDRVVLMGGGSGNASEPVGVYHTAGVNENEMGTDGADLTDYDPFLEGIESIENANGTASAVIFSPRTKADLSTLVTGITSDLTKLSPPEDFKNLRKYVTTAIPNDLTWGSCGGVSSAAFMGGFSNVWIGLRNQVRIDVSPHGNDVFNRMGLWIRAYIRADVAIVRPNQLVRITGITSSR